MRLFLFSLFVPLMLNTAMPQQFTNWQNHTNMKIVSDVLITDGEIWAATGGGGFVYSFQNNSYSILHKSDGLKGTYQSAITTKNSKTWFGSVDGVIDVFNKESGEFSVILDIFNSNQTNRTINELAIAGDTLIVSSDFGVSLVDVNSYIFFDTFLKFGSFPSNTKVNNTLKTDLFYVCTNQGIAIQKANAINLSAPESWDVYSSANGLPSNKTIKAAMFNGNLIVSTDEGFAILNGSIWSTFIPELNGKNIADYIIHENSIYIISENKFFLYLDNTPIIEVFSSTETFKKLSHNENSGFAIATDAGVIYLAPDLSSTLLIPNSPPANQFPSMTVDAGNNLWSASGKDGSGVGYYVFDTENWYNFDINNQPGLPSNGVWSTYASADGKVYLGTWGRGFVEVENNNLTTYNRENSGMQGIPENTDYIVVTGFGNDSRNNLWILNYWAADRNTLSMKTPEDEWFHFTIPAAQNRILREHQNLAVDPYDTKWFSSSDAARAGLYYFNENKTYENPADDRSEYISTADGLNTNDIRAIVIDKRGDVWIGTSLGVNVLTNTSTIPSSNNPPLLLSNIFTLRQQSINAMVVDPLNQKWVGTNEGLLLLNSDGSRLIATFTTKNSALLSDQIRSLAIDESAGILYVGTDNGLTSFETPYIKPLENFDELFVFPNPFRLKDKSKSLTIDGLIRDTDIKVLSLNGNLINEFSSPGGRTAYWDGTDFQGNLVNSGVYIIVAFDREGNNVTTGKVAVLRE